MSDIVRYYDKEKNPRGATFPFQPLSDITTEEWADLTDVQQASVDASGFWRKTKPRPAAKDEAEPATKKVARIATVGTDADAPVVPESEAVNG